MALLLSVKSIESLLCSLSGTQLAESMFSIFQKLCTDKTSHFFGSKFWKSIVKLLAVGLNYNWIIYRDLYARIRMCFRKVLSLVCFRIKSVIFTLCLKVFKIGKNTEQTATSTTHFFFSRNVFKILAVVSTCIYLKRDRDRSLLKLHEDGNTCNAVNLNKA